MAVDARFGKEVKAIHYVMFAADTVNAAKSLNQPHWVPMQVVVNDLVTVLKVQAFGEHVGRDDRLSLRFTGSHPVFPVRLWSESPHDSILALIAAEDYFEFVLGDMFCKVVVQVPGSIRILGEDQAFASAQRILLQSTNQ